MLMRDSLRQMFGVPILDRPERRSQSGLCVDVHRKYGFQSSIAPKDDRNSMLILRLKPKYCSNPRSPRKTIAIVPTKINPPPRCPFQSSIAPKDDRNWVIDFGRLGLIVPILDRPERRSQSFPTSDRRSTVPQSSNPRSPRKTIAISENMAIGGDGFTFQSSIAPKDDRNQRPG